MNLHCEIILPEADVTKCFIFLSRFYHFVDLEFRCDRVSDNLVKVSLNGRPRDKTSTEESIRSGFLNICSSQITFKVES